MKALYMLIFITLILENSAVCQNCLPEGINIKKQEQIDNFKNLYPGCVCIEGNVKIWDPSSVTIFNLDGLDQVTSILGNLEIEFNNYLESLSGLENLTVIGGNLEIVGNNELNDISALHKLTSIGGNFRVALNAYLLNITGLDNLANLGGNLDLTHNNLTSLAGMPKLKAIGGSFFLAANNSLTNLQGLDSLKTISGMIEMSGNDALVNLKGLGSLESIGGDLWLHYNDALSSLMALSHLTSLGGGGVSIHNNAALTSLTGIDNISAGTVSGFYIVNNPQLDKCEVKSLCDYLSAAGGPIDIVGNADGCRSSFIVGVACMNDVEDNNPPGLRILISPNPVSSCLTVELPSEMIPSGTYIMVYDLTGTELIRIRLKETFTHVDMADLAKGIYLLKVLGEKYVLTKKLVKE